MCQTPGANVFSDQCSFHPVPFKFPGASTEELLLSAVDSLHQTVKNTTAPPAELNAAVQSLVESTNHLRAGYVPPGPVAPDGLSAREVAALTPSPIVVTTPTQTPPLVLPHPLHFKGCWTPHQQLPPRLLANRRKLRSQSTPLFLQFQLKGCRPLSPLPPLFNLKG